MALETFAFIDSLVNTNPTDGDPKKEGDDHLRGIKSTLLTTFPNITGAITTTQDELNKLDGVTATTAEINILDGVTATTAEINKLDGVTATTTELNYIDGVTSAIQTQLNSLDTLKAPKASPALTGVPTAPTAAPSTNTTQLATTAFVINESFSSSIPVVAGDAGKLFGNNGSVASWTGTLNVDENTLIDGTDNTKKVKLDLSNISSDTTRTFLFPNQSGNLISVNSSNILNNKTIPIDDDNLTIRANGDTSKTINFDISNVTTSTNRQISVADNDMTLDTPGWNLLATSTASGVTSHDIEWTNGTYEAFVILGKNMTLVSGVNDRFAIRMRVGGSYVTTGVYDSTVIAGLVGSAESPAGGTSQTTGLLMGAVQQTTSEATRMRMYIDDPEDSLQHIVDGDMKYTSNVPSASHAKFNVACRTVGVLTGIQIRTQLGNNFSGDFKIYGIRSAI